MNWWPCDTEVTLWLSPGCHPSVVNRWFDITQFHEGKLYKGDGNIYHVPSFKNTSKTQIAIYFYMKFHLRLKALRTMNNYRKEIQEQHN